MNRPLYYRLEGHEPVPVHDVTLWARDYKDQEGRVVRQEALPNGLWVSTVFLGVDHNFAPSGPPVLFETMVFDTSDGDTREELRCERCSTWGDAVAPAREGGGGGDGEWNEPPISKTPRQAGGRTARDP